MRRTGRAKDFAPISFPGVIGVDVAGTVISCGGRGKLTIPIVAKMALKDASEAHILMSKGANGKVLLVP